MLILIEEFQGMLIGVYKGETLDELQESVNESYTMSAREDPGDAVDYMESLFAIRKSLEGWVEDEYVDDSQPGVYILDTHGDSDDDQLILINTEELGNGKEEE